ncbi:hypothetical protein TNCV_4383211 [Trichonephila clavipes]|nr:hypothetical protein TNCV_4383211 [Trichonephila clavipes]
MTPELSRNTVGHDLATMTTQILFPQGSWAVTSAETGEYFPPLQSPCRNCGGGDIGGVAIYRPFGDFRRAKSYCHLYGAQGQRQASL